ncbi:tannase/feruloyl esterase family alpha/beta hydrolase [Sphingomonas canadensis]|uniref:Tannase/feruloyl esterase family alpha/beta hydrolase n=1 Tax=Sphingomonas canadensis TaxID=1219257 RepID=A0ABW3HEL5_9SPHN|nr:tannase/feruloyl esterase family alpha/beta hydrolase [Sphingomonas canadensis]MCW3837649.1 tannase/feruloyl esterase family alpha/beta hydrolase [Sphingomonas canadensis]
MRGRLATAASLAALACAACTATSTPVADTGGGPAPAADARCAAIAGKMNARLGADTRITAAEYRPAGPMAAPPGPPGFAMPPVDLPDHCEIGGTINPRTGIDGQSYAITFRLRLPENWNGRFLMEGGGGTNGIVGEAIGRMAGGPVPALAQGYAVLAQDSGHSNATNSVAEKGGATAFGFDPQARADYGGASLAPVTLAARDIATEFYGKPPEFSYFVGCSKGGQEGMMLAQRYPDLYDGIIAGAPGFALPRAAIAEVWDTQAFASVVRAKGEEVTLASLAASFGNTDLAVARDAVLKACDAGDGREDGLIGAFEQCTSAKVLPELERRICTGAKQDGCLSRPQVDALIRVHDGPRNSKGEALYAGFPWDAGWADMGWRVWKIGSPDGRMPAINVAMGTPALAAIFTTPPTAPGATPVQALAYAMGFDFDRDAPGIYATGGAFTRSAWQDIGARSPDLAAFARRGGRMIVPHGVSDPVFSINDTIAWWNDVNGRSHGKAASFARVFPVPGMAHCMGGPATDQFNDFAALVDWVEKGKAPDRIDAKAGPMSPWPGRSRPLCPYPKIARPKPGATGDTAEDFVCS